MKGADRALLELAAKAAGRHYNPTAQHDDGLVVVREGARCQSDQVLWNPLDDDGDALRLAVRLGLRMNLNFRTGADERAGVAVWGPTDNEPYPPFWTASAPDLTAAVRQTIVRAAAEIGSKMP